MPAKLQIQMLGLPRSGTYFTTELITNNSIENSVQFFDDNQYWKHFVYPMSITEYSKHFEDVDIILLIYKDLCSWLESNTLRWQDFDFRILNGDKIDVFEPTTPELTIVNDNMYGHPIPERRYNLANMVKVYNMFHYNWLVNNPWFAHDPNFKKKMVVVAYEDLLYEQNIIKFFNVIKSKGIKTKTNDYKVPALGTVHLSQRKYPVDHLEKYKNKQTTVLTDYQKHFAYEQLSKEVKDLFSSLKDYQLV